MKYIITKEMIKNSLVSKGDISRLIRVIDKAKNGQDITIAFVGGSITQGCNATTKENCYVSRTYSWFKETFKNININCINSGVGATGSIIGVHRVKKVLSHNPDIVFIDFAVNDKSSIYDKIAYESLVRRILSNENHPAIIEVFMSNFDGSNVQEQQIEIGKKYNIPMISFRDTIQKEIKNGRFKWQDVATDEVHPNDYGHFIISELLIDFIKNIYNDLDKEFNNEVNYKLIELGDPVFGEDYICGEIKNNKNLKVDKSKGILEDFKGFQVFCDGWNSSRVKGDKAVIRVDLKGKNIFLLYKKSIKKTAGKMKVTVDGNEPIIIDTYFDNGWGDYSATELLAQGDSFDNHSIEINLIDDEYKNEIYIMGFLVS